jgi:hypothetical protein
MGGLFPEQMRGRHMWYCGRPAAGIFRMVCRCQHRGQPVPLCGPGLVRAPDGQVMPHPGHVAEVARRQAGLCPACVWPPQARQHHEAGQHYERELRAAIAADNAPAVRNIKQAMLDAGAAIQELYERGIVHKCPLVLVEVS